MINIGGMQNQPYLSAGTATARFGYTSMAPNSNSKTGAFWDTQKRRDGGKLGSQQRREHACQAGDASRRLDSLGLGFPPDTRCAEHDRREPGRRDGVFPLRKECS